MDDGQAITTRGERGGRPAWLPAGATRRSHGTMSLLGPGTVGRHAADGSGDEDKRGPQRGRVRGGTGWEVSALATQRLQEEPRVKRLGGHGGQQVDGVVARGVVGTGVHAECAPEAKEGNQSDHDG